jgi:hypothetical protein
MKKSAKTPTTPDAWEQGTLGRDEASVRRSSPAREHAVDDALGLQMISIRLPRELLSRVKLIAGYRGVAYQPLMRDVLGRWARAEMVEIARQTSAEDRAEKALRTAQGRRRLPSSGKARDKRDRLTSAGGSSS